MFNAQTFLIELIKTIKTAKKLGFELSKEFIIDLYTTKHSLKLIHKLIEIYFSEVDFL